MLVHRLTIGLDELLARIRVDGIEEVEVLLVRNGEGLPRFLLRHTLERLWRDTASGSEFLRFPKSWR